MPFWDAIPIVSQAVSLGQAIADDMAANDGLITMEEIENYQIFERPPVRGFVRGHEIVAPPPPSSGATHIIQMLKILDHFPIAEMGFASPDYTHLLSEAMKIALVSGAGGCSTVGLHSRPP